MNRRSSKSPRSPICLLILFATAWLLQPSEALAAKTPASEALATALSNGTFDQVRQEMLMDLPQKQRFDFDEEGMEELGRNLVAQGQIEAWRRGPATQSDDPSRLPARCQRPR